MGVISFNHLHTQSYFLGKKIRKSYKNTSISRKKLEKLYFSIETISQKKNKKKKDIQRGSTKL